MTTVRLLFTGLSISQRNNAAMYVSMPYCICKEKRTLKAVITNKGTRAINAKLIYLRKAGDAASFCFIGYFLGAFAVFTLA